MRPRAFDRALERCIAETLRTGDIEAALAPYPRQADALRPLVRTALRLQKHLAKAPAPASSLAAAKKRLMHSATQIGTTGLRRRQRTGDRTGPTQRRQPMFGMTLAYRLVALLISVAVGTAALGGGTVWAAAESLPGGPVYPLKIALEQAQLRRTVSEETRTELALRFASERADEAEALMQRARAIPEGTAERVTEHLQYAIQQASELPAEQAQAMLLRIAQHAEEQARWMARLAESAGDADGELARIQHAFQMGSDQALAAAVGLQGGSSEGDGAEQEREQERARDAEPQETPEPEQEREREEEQERNADQDNDDAERDRDRDRDQEGDGDGPGDGDDDGGAPGAGPGDGDDDDDDDDPPGAGPGDDDDDDDNPGAGPGDGDDDDDNPGAGPGDGDDDDDDDAPGAEPGDGDDDDDNPGAGPGAGGDDDDDDPGEGPGDDDDDDNPGAGSGDGGGDDDDDDDPSTGSGDGGDDDRPTGDSGRGRD